MVDELQARAARLRFRLVLFLLAFPLAVRAQTTSTPSASAGATSDALTFLNGVLERYAKAKTYYIESIEETELNTELRRTWEKRLTIAVMLPNNRYRFEQRSDIGWGIQVSDGKTEWVYVPGSEQYTEQPTQASGPSHLRSLPIPGVPRITEAQNTLKKFSGVQSFMRSATYLADEKIDWGGKSNLCTVIQGHGVMGNGPRKIHMLFIFWIDKKTGVVWKQIDRRVGPLRPDNPDVEYTMERTTWFARSDVEVQSAPDRLFVLERPSTAKFVKEFEGRKTEGVREFVGRQAPPLSLHSNDGVTVSLGSIQGKPVLLDFWATWCAPCLESLPSVERLYQETMDKGLVLLSIDDDEDAKTATEFLAMRKEPWPNFHYTDEIASSFPEHGIPYFVLIDASGKVVFSKEGFDESGLRAALAKLGPAFASLSKASAP
jgi:thiol-disulfide isomerase/thioredoxin